MRTRASYLPFLVLLTLGCQLLSPAALSDPTRAGPSPAAPDSQATATVTTTPTPAFTPTPTRSPLELVEAAAPACESAFTASLEPDTPTGPFLVLTRGSEEGAEWSRIELLPFGVEAASAEAVAGLVCIRSSNEQTTTYTDGQPGYRTDWRVRLVSWPEGVPVAEVALRGANPPGAKFHRDPAYGAPPRGQLLSWVLETIGDRTIRYIGKAVSEVVFSPDGSLLAVAETTRASDQWSGVFEGGVLLIDLPSGEEISTLTGHAVVSMARRVSTIAISPDGRLLASGGGDLAVILWDLSTRSKVRTLLGGDVPVSTDVRDVTFSPDGSTLAVVDSIGFPSLWNTATGQPVPGFEPFGGESNLVVEVAFSPDGRLMAGAGGQGSVLMMDAASGRIVEELGSGARVVSVAFAPSGEAIAAGREDGSVEILGAADGAVMFRMLGHGGQVNSVAFSSDGSRLVSGGSDGNVIVWDARTGAPLGLLEGHDGPVWSVAFSPDGKWVASGSEDQYVKLWSLDEVLKDSPEAVATRIAPTATPTPEPVTINVEEAVFLVQIARAGETVSMTFVPQSGRSLAEWIPAPPDSWSFFDRVFLIDADEGGMYFVSPDYEVSRDPVPSVTLRFEGVPESIQTLILNLLGTTAWLEP